MIEVTGIYKEMAQQAQGLVAGETDVIANMANISALLNMHLKDINWVGFYLVKDQELVLGPFQGKPACIRIPVGRGVCGTAVATGEVQCIDDVHQFAGHIACDAASNSEIVLPIRHQNNIVAVLDIDSPIHSRFDQIDVDGLSGIVNVLEASLA